MIMLKKDCWHDLGGVRAVRALVWGVGFVGEVLMNWGCLGCWISKRLKG